MSYKTMMFAAYLCLVALVGMGSLSLGYERGSADTAKKLADERASELVDKGFNDSISRLKLKYESCRDGWQAAATHYKKLETNNSWIAMHKRCNAWF